jgi:hypothetical protein
MWRGARSLLPEAAGGPRENRNPMYEYRNSFPLPVALLIMCIFMGGQNSLKKWLTIETLRTLLLDIDIDIDID